MKRLFKIAIMVLLVSCSGHGQFAYVSDLDHAKWIDANDSLVVSISPFDGHCDTLVTDHPFTSVVCMSSTSSAGFAEIGAAQLVSGISGLRYISNEEVRSHAVEIGNEAELDYERILSLHPDVVLVYGISSARPPYMDKLTGLGLKCFQLYDHLESSPLGRAEYIKAYGAMAGMRETADSVFDAVRKRYEELRAQDGRKLKVLINSPFSDAWYIPGKDSYMSRLIEDAGGEILGSRSGMESSVISLEKAWMLSKEADIWLNPGRGERPSMINVDRVYDNSLRTTAEGGNDFWERGAVRPDLVLSDLRQIFAGEENELYFYLKIQTR